MAYNKIESSDLQQLEKLLFPNNGVAKRTIAQYSNTTDSTVHSVICRRHFNNDRVIENSLKMLGKRTLKSLRFLSQKNALSDELKHELQKILL